MNLYKSLEIKAKKKQKTIILPESYDKRVLNAVKYILKKKIAKIILISTGKNIPLNENINLDIIDVGFSEQFAVEYKNIAQKKVKGYSLNDSKKALTDPMTFACLLLKNNFADAVVAGAVFETSHVIRNAIQIIGTEKNNRTVSSFFMFTFPGNHRYNNKIIAYADCGVLPNPDSDQLSDIAIQTSRNYTRLTGLRSRAAFLSFSTKGSAKDETIDKIIKAYRLTKKRNPKLVCDGELQFDAAIVPEIAKRKNPRGAVKGNANVFIFPDLNSGNIAYKITERIGGATATGPIVQGLAKPVMDLSRGCSSRDIINMILTAINLK